MLPRRTEIGTWRWFPWQWPDGVKLGCPGLAGGAGEGQAGYLRSDGSSSVCSTLDRCHHDCDSFCSWLRTLLYQELQKHSTDMLFGLKSLQATHWRATVDYLFFTGNFQYYFPCEVIFSSFLARNKPDCCQVLKDFFGLLGSEVERTKERYSQDNLAFLVSFNAKRRRNKTSPLKPKKESSQDGHVIFSFPSRKFPLNKPLRGWRNGIVVVVPFPLQKAF